MNEPLFWLSRAALGAAAVLLLGCGRPRRPGAGASSPPNESPPLAAAAASAGIGSPRTMPDGTCFACQDGRIPLHDDWTLQSSAKIRASGGEIATARFSTEGWYPTQVPSTVLAALVANHVYSDPYVGKNLAAIPGAPFDVSWWYRTEFRLPAEFAGHAVWLDLDGINYRANVWMNGQRVAESKDLVGTFTTHEWEITSMARPGEANALAIEVFAPDLRTDLALNWLDWNPAPPDRDMGIWRAAYIKKSGAVALRGARVLSKVDVPSLASAKLTVKAEVRNTTARPVLAVVTGTIETIEVKQEVPLGPRETKSVLFDASRYPALDLRNPRLWWPAQMGPPNQYDLVLRATVEGKESDVQPVRFGIRDVTFDLTHDGARVFRINGKRILIRGGGWAPDMMLRASPERLAAELAYVNDLGLNAIRLEGKLETDEFYSMCDARGILAIPGWMCCDRWQKCSVWTKSDHDIATLSMKSEAARLRNHPSVIDFLIGSDEAPPPDVEEEFLGALKEADWPNPISPAASKRTSLVLGPSGVKMTGPYDWVAPGYWSGDVAHRAEEGSHGGAFGFNTETGPGPAIPELESLRAALSRGELEDLWSKPKAPQFHAGAKSFDNVRLFNEALAARHGKPTSLEDYVRKAQLMNYEAERAMFEAFGRYKYASATGVIHWMLNNAWPSLIWHLYGYDLSTAAGYFGAKKGNEPIHILYSYDDRSVVVVNHTPRTVTGLRAVVRVYNRDAVEKFAYEGTVDVAEDATAQVTTIPLLEGLSGVYFVRLVLERGGQVVSSNFYWLSKKPEIIKFEETDWDHTPTSQYADYSALAQMPPVILRGTSSSKKDGPEGITRVVVTNPSASVAFFVRLHLQRPPTEGAAAVGDGRREVVPVLWQDNYVSLMPGETRELEVRYRAADLGGKEPTVEVSGWNVAPKILGGRD